MTKNILSQSGRSMVEMIAVLGVMGVLSTLAVYGYQTAMTKNRANTIIDEVQKRATATSPKIHVLNNLTPSLSEFSNNNLGYASFDTTVYTPTNLSTMPTKQFGIKVENVSKEICQKILETVGSENQILRLSLYESPAVAITECTDQNAFLFVYNDDLTASDTGASNGAPASFDCTPYADAECGSCDPATGYTPKDSDCTGNENGWYCVEGKCVLCEPNYFWWTDGQCVECISNDWYTTPELYKHSCIGSMVYVNGSKMLAGCDHSRSGNAANADETSCKACPNRCFDASDNNTCKRSEPNQRYTKDENGNCVCKNWDNNKCLCPNNQFFNNNSHCSDCINVNDWYNTTEEHRHNCLSSMFYQSNSPVNHLWGCITSSDKANADETSCKACAERCYDNGTCRLMGTTYTKNSDGNCIAN